MPYTNYADGTIIFASQLNADNTTSLDLNTASPQTIQSAITVAGLTTSPLTVNGLATFAGARVDNVKIIGSGASYAVLPTDRYLLCQTGAAITVGLPSGPAAGRKLTIKDSGGTATTGTITITPATGLIDGLSSYVINANYGGVTLIFSGSKWLSVAG